MFGCTCEGREIHKTKWCGSESYEMKGIDRDTDRLIWRELYNYRVE